MGPAAAVSILIARGAPTPWRRCERALACMFIYKGCRDVARLVGEAEELRQMMESMKRIVTDWDWKRKEKKPGIEWQNWENRRSANK